MEVETKTETVERKREKMKNSEATKKTKRRKKRKKITTLLQSDISIIRTDLLINRLASINNKPMRIN